MKTTVISSIRQIIKKYFFNKTTQFNNNLNKAYSKNTEESVQMHENVEQEVLEYYLKATRW